MTSLLKKATEELKKLSKSEQNAYALGIFEDLKIFKAVKKGLTSPVIGEYSIDSVLKKAKHKQ